MLDPMFSQSPRIEIVHVAEHKIIILNRPTLSTTGPGKPRPKIEAAFRIASMLWEVDWRLFEVAYMVIYAGGTSTAQSRINIADIVRINRWSLKPYQSNISRAREFLGRRVFKRNVPNRMQNALIRAKQRMVHANPIRPVSLTKTIGYNTPPNPPAVVARPVARPRFRSNQCPTVAILVVHSIEDAPPPKQPKARMN